MAQKVNLGPKHADTDFAFLKLLFAAMLSVQAVHFSEDSFGTMQAA